MKLSKLWAQQGRAIARFTSSAAAVIFFAAASQNSQAIVFGQLDGDGHPNVGAMLVTFEGETFPICSGSLVHKSDGTGVFLSAGHCTAFLENLIAAGIISIHDVHVTFDENAVTGQQIPVTQIHTFLVPRPSFNNWEDVGALVLEAESGADLPDPVTLAQPGFLDNFSKRQLHRAEFVAVGYGASILFPPPQLYWADIRQVAYPQGLNLVGTSILFQQNGPAGNSGDCFGDSGGPIFWKDPATGHEIQVAVVSGGPNFCISTAVHYRLDTAIAHDFLNYVIEAASAP